MEAKLRLHCECGDYAHHLILDPDEDGSLIISLENGETSLKSRIILAWNILLYGSGTFSEVFLDSDAIAELKSFLLKRTNKDESTAASQTTKV